MTESSVDRWRSLRAEYEQVVIGELWLAEIAEAAATVVRSYPPAVYAETGQWNADAIEDVVADVTTRQLLGDNQLRYIIDTARTVSDARGLLRQNVRWTLARRRQRTVIDNLLDRCRQLRAEPTGPLTRTPSDHELRDAVALVREAPRVRILGGDRAPVVFTTATLRQMLNQLAEALPSGYGDRELAIIFERALTPHLPSALVIYDGNYDEPDPTLSAEEMLIVRQSATELHAALSAEQRLLMALKLASVSDADAASHLGLSRPTVASRKKAVSQILNRGLLDVPGHLHDAVLVGLTQLLGADVPEQFAADYPDTSAVGNA